MINLGIGFLFGVVTAYTYIALTYSGHFSGKPFSRSKGEVKNAE